MTDNNYTEALGHIAWGYLLLYLDFNLGTLDILPNWLGYLLIYQAITTLGEREPSALLLKPFGLLLTLYEACIWTLEIFSSTPPYLATLLFAVLTLYFHFQLLTNLASIALRSNLEGVSRRLLQLRTVCTLLYTTLFLPIPWDQFNAAGFILGIVTFFADLWLCTTLFSYRRQERELL